MGQPSLGIFLQVRLASQRLPEKALLPLGDSTVIEQAMAALSGVPATAHALLTDAASASALQEAAECRGFEVFVGPELDVLKRFRDAAELYGVDRVVRATGDSPLVSPAMLRDVLLAHARSGADLSHFIGCPLGTGVEVIELGALREADEAARDPAEREHMTTYVHRHPELFRILQAPVGPEREHLNANVSVDTSADYDRVRAIYAELYRGAPIEVELVVAWLRAHPDFVSLKRINY